MSDEKANVPHEVDPLDMLELGPVPEQPTPTEPPQEETPVEPPPQEETPQEQTPINPLEEEYKKRGLDKRFKGGPEKAFDYIPVADKYITTLEQERADLKRQLEEAKRTRTVDQDIDPNQFLENPTATIRKIREDFQHEIEQFRNNVTSDLEMTKAQIFMESTKDFGDYRDDMQRELMAHPELQSIAPSKAIQIIYKMAKASRIPEIVDDATRKARGDNPNRERAETSAGNTSQRAPGLTPEKLAAMSDEELLKVMRSGT